MHGLRPAEAFEAEVSWMPRGGFVRWGCQELEGIRMGIQMDMGVSDSLGRPRIGLGKCQFLWVTMVYGLAFHRKPSL